MGRPPARTKYLSVTLPLELVEQIRASIERDDDRFYTSVPDFIKDAVRRRLDDLNQRLGRLQPDVDRAAAKLRAGAPTTGNKFCHKCGNPLVPGGPYCSSCGTKAP